MSNLLTYLISNEYPFPGFSLGRLHMGGFVIWGGGQVQGDKALMGGLMRGDIDLMGGGLTFIDYIIN